MTSSATKVDDEPTHGMAEPALIREERRLGWRLAGVGVGMVLLHFTLILPMMNGYDLNPLSLLLAVSATGCFAYLWDKRGNAVEQLASFRADGSLQPLGPARLSNVVANWKSVWPLFTLLTAPITIGLLIAIIGPPS